MNHVAAKQERHSDDFFFGGVNAFTTRNPCLGTNYWEFVHGGGGLGALKGLRIPVVSFGKYFRQKGVYLCRSTRVDSSLWRSSVPRAKAAL